MTNEPDELLPKTPPPDEDYAGPDVRMDAPDEPAAPADPAVDPPTHTENV